VNVVKATHRFEEWLGRHTVLLKPDLRLKHKEMAKSPFRFLRATFYRWAQIWPEICPELAKAPRVLAVGDLHVENFGTWQDLEGRLVWGANDFDEAAEMPYTVDLVRLASSALLAVDEGQLKLRHKDVCGAVLEGYRESLEEGGAPFVVEEDHDWLRQLITGGLRSPVKFWKKLGKCPVIHKDIPLTARDALEQALPRRDLKYKVVKRVSGLGSLGRLRFVAIAEYEGAKIAREAKASVASSVYWANKTDQPVELMCQLIAGRAVRCHDPFIHLHDRWIVRRLSPHCSRVELADLPKQRDETRLLHAMGWETANIHLGSVEARKQVRHHLKLLKGNWLATAAKKMAGAVQQDQRAWRKEWES